MSRHKNRPAQPAASSVQVPPDVQSEFNELAAAELGNDHAEADEPAAAPPAAMGLLPDDGAGETDTDLADDLDDAADETPPSASPAPAPPVRQGVVVLCPYCVDQHGKKTVQCKAGRTEAFFTRYYCPSKGCTFSQKVPRPKAIAQFNREQLESPDFSAR